MRFPQVHKKKILGFSRDFQGLFSSVFTDLRRNFKQDDGGGDITGAIRRSKALLQSNHHHQQSKQMLQVTQNDRITSSICYSRHYSTSVTS